MEYSELWSTANYADKRMNDGVQRNFVLERQSCTNPKYRCTNPKCRCTNSLIRACVAVLAILKLSNKTPIKNRDNEAQLWAMS